MLDVFDDILECCCAKEDGKWTLPGDTPQEAGRKPLLLAVLQFTALMIEHSFTRHLYSSMEHLITLLSSSDMTVVLTVLNLLYVFRYLLLLMKYMYMYMHIISSLRVPLACSTAIPLNKCRLVSAKSSFFLQ